MDKKPTRSAPEKVLLILGAAFAGAGLILAALGLLVGLHPWSPALAILGGLGALFFTIGASLATVSIVKTRRSARLLNEGRRLSGEILGVEQNIYATVNHVHPWRIRCQVYLPGSEDPIACLSPDWTIDPTPLITSQGITTLPVYIDRDNPHSSQPYVDDTALRSAMGTQSRRGTSTFTIMTYPKR